MSADVTATACAHCGLPVDHPDASDGPQFCCNACRTVHEALHASGLATRFYRLQASSAARRAATDAAPESVLLELDSPLFLTEHTREESDGCRSTELHVEGVHCAACLWLVERLPAEVPGVQTARLDLARSRLRLRWNPDEVALSSIARHLGRFGYGAKPLRATRGRSASGQSDEERRLLVRAGVTWALALNIMLLAFAYYTGLDALQNPALFAAGRWLALALATAALAVGGRGFFHRAFRSIQSALRRRTLHGLDMDTPIALGLAAGYLDSARATLQGVGDIWFDSLSVLVAALLTARWLQVRSRRLAGDASDRLLALLPSMARRLDMDGRSMSVPAISLKPADRIEVHPGEVFPVDGILIEGKTSLDRSVMTGESRAVAASPGTHVLAGETNLSRRVVVRVDRTGDRTRIGALLARVRSASDQPAPVVQLADRVAGWFVAVVLALALVTAVGAWLWAPGTALSRVVALLVVSCPCALGMSTPLAMAIATGRAARAGVFIKSEAALQRLAMSRVLVFDKTGTLTQGRLSIEEQVGDASLLALGAGLEVGLMHPVARALRDAVSSALPVPDAGSVERVPGKGVLGRYDGRLVRVGRPDWVGPLPDPLREAEARFVARGRTPVAISVDGTVVILLGLVDLLRPESRDVVAGLRRGGRRVMLLSGDHPDIVHEMATATGIADYEGHLDPDEKRNRIRALRSNGDIVVMVGDGVNDATALSAADVGIAVAGGSEASLVAADVFATRGGLDVVSNVLHQAQRAMAVVRRNLGVSLAYNAVMAVLAMGGWVGPLLAAVAMPISSLSVVASSLLQPTFRTPAKGQSK